MKKMQPVGFCFLTAIIVAVLAGVLSSCDTNMPELNETSRQKLVGSWQLKKETWINGDGFGGEFTREGNSLWNNILYEFTVNQVTRIVIPNYDNEAGTSYVAPATYDYSLKQQQDGTWLLTVTGLFDKQRNPEGGCSPVTIQKLTKNRLEWEFEAYGGDEGPVGYYQYFERIK